MSVIVLASGCRAVAPRSEKQAREDMARLAHDYRPEGMRYDLAPLEPRLGLTSYVHFALLKQPRVEAAYYDWVSSVERITLERSLPDPVLGFQSDIADTVMTLMPGIMQVIPGPGKLKASADLAAAESRVRYADYETAVLQTAFEVKRSFYELHFLEERIRINQENLERLRQFEAIARAQNEAGKVTLQDVLRAQMLYDSVQTELANLEDSRSARRAAFKASLGLSPQDPDPAVPEDGRASVLDPDPDSLRELAFQRNPQLRRVRAEVVALQARIAVAYRQNVPDFSVGVMADVKASPVMVRPLAGMTLPIWRDKVAAGIAQAEAAQLAAQARLAAEEIDLAVILAEKLFAYREITRNLELLRGQLIPKAGLSVSIAQAGYLAGSISFFNLIEAERARLAYQLSEVEAQTRREILLAELSLLIAGVPPPHAALLAKVNSDNP